MTPEERAAARALKCLQPLAADGGIPKARRGQEVEIDFHDPADLPEAAGHRTAVDELEPLNAFSVAIENLDCQEITDAADCFRGGLTWALDVIDQRDLVAIGNRAWAFHCRGDAARPGDGMSSLSGPGLALRTNPHRRPPGALGRRVFPVRWRHGRHLWAGARMGAPGHFGSEIGERLCLVAYVVRPTMMGSPTLHQLGEVMNKTRQAKDKLAGCLRDTFAGIRAMAQRGEATRDRCIASH